MNMNIRVLRVQVSCHILELDEAVEVLEQHDQQAIAAQKRGEQERQGTRETFVEAYYKKRKEVRAVFVASGVIEPFVPEVLAGVAKGKGKGSGKGKK